MSSSPTTDHAPPAAVAEENFWYLMSALEVLDGFGLYLVECDSEDARREMTRRAKGILARHDTQVIEVDLHARTDVLQALIEACPQPPGRAVLSAHGLERPAGREKELRQALRGMNLQRERFRDELRFPVVLWLYRETLAALATTAPDFHDWRSGFYYVPAHEVGTSHVFEAARQSGLIGEGSRVSAPEARRRLDGLVDLLADLRAAPDTRQNRQALFLTGSRAAALLRDAGRYSEAVSLCRELLGRAQDAGDASWAAQLQVHLGDAWADLPTGERAGNLRRAIGCYETALRVYTEEAFPAEWAVTHNNLGIAYGSLPTGERAENLRRAIECFEAALRVCTEEEFPANWAAMQTNLGNAYRDLPTGDRAQNLRRAVECCEAALRVWTEEAFPAQWAGTQINLGIAYGSLPTGDRAENLRRAIECHEAALRVFAEETFPAAWATTQRNLGIEYANLPTGDRTGNLRRAIGFYEAALRVYTKETFPADWASTQSSLGSAYGSLPTGDRAENVLRAIECYEAALRVYAEEAFPRESEMAQRNLALARRALGELEKQP